MISMKHVFSFVWFEYRDVKSIASSSEPAQQPLSLIHSSPTEHHIHVPDPIAVRASPGR